MATRAVPRLFLFSLLASATIAGCASSSVVPQADQVQCFAGVSELRLGNGSALPAGDVLARRTLSPSSGTITEEVVVPGGRPGVTAREFVVDMTVRGRTVTLSERSGAFAGEGTLRGPSWAWTSWRTETRLPSGQRVVSEDTLRDGGLTVEKQVYGSDGRVQVVMVERYKPVTPGVFDDRRARMLEARAAPGPSP